MDPGRSEMTATGPGAQASPWVSPADTPGGGPDVGPSRLLALFDQNYDFVWRQLRRLGVPMSIVDDAAQQVFIIASRKLGQVDAGKERAYCFGIARRVAADARTALRRQQHRREELPVDYKGSRDAEPDTLLEHKQARALLDEMLDSMSEDLRAVFVLYEIEGLSTPEIATLLGIPVGTAASRLRRARAAFEERVTAFRNGRGGDEHE